MKKISFLLIIFIFFNTISFKVIAHNIRSIDLDFIIDNSHQYKDFLIKLMKFKSSKELVFLVLENDILKKRKEIENNKILMSEEIIQGQIDKYNLNLKKYEEEISIFNQIISKNIEINRKIMIDNIIEITSRISDQKNYDMIINKNNYFMSSVDIDITDFILSEINSRNIILSINKKIDSD